MWILIHSQTVCGFSSRAAWSGRASSPPLLLFLFGNIPKPELFQSRFISDMFDLFHQGTCVSWWLVSGQRWSEMIWKRQDPWFCMSWASKRGVAPESMQCIYFCMCFVKVTQIADQCSDHMVIYGQGKHVLSGGNSFGWFKWCPHFMGTWTCANFNVYNQRQQRQTSLS